MRNFLSYIFVIFNRIFKNKKRVKFCKIKKRTNTEFFQKFLKIIYQKSPNVFIFDFFDKKYIIYLLIMAKMLIFNIFPKTKGGFYENFFKN